MSCAKCGCEPHSRFGFDHEYVAPEPQPGANWQRPVCTEQFPCGGCFKRGLCDQLMWDSGEAAGRARGIEEEQKRCEGIAPR